MSEPQHDPSARPPGEHESELPGPADREADDVPSGDLQEENAETSLDEPSDGSGGE